MNKAATICDFCAKLNTEVAVMIAGLNVAICNECVALAHDICREKMAEDNGEVSPP